MRSTILAALAALLLFTTVARPAAAADPENTIYLDLRYGRVVIELLPQYAPNHVERIKKLTREGFYDGIVFHRVINGFMAQTGDPTGTGFGSSDYPDLKAEFTTAWFERGTLGMARGNDPDTGNSQFFICFRSRPDLDGQYTVFGKVVSGMEYVDKIRRGEPPRNPDKIIRMQVAADVTE